MQRVYVGGRRLTLITYPDFSFRDEWSGLYDLDEKVMDYIAVKTKWGWAAPENAIPEKTVYGTGGITFHHDVNGHPVRVELTIRKHPHRGSELEWIEIRVDGSDENELELGVCGRHAYDDQCGDVEIIGDEWKYVKAGRNSILITPDNGEPSANDLGQRVHKQGEKEYLIRVIRVPFRGEVKIDVRRSPTRLVRTVSTANASFHSDSDQWNELYRRAKATIRILTKRRGWYAGLPWFVQYWGRDTFISVPALVREGYAPLVKRTLLDFLYSKVDGEIPRLIRENGVPEFGSIDTNPLFLNAVIPYVNLSGDYRFVSENLTDIVEALLWLYDTENIPPKSRGKDTWMDTLEIRRYPVEVMAYIVNAVRGLAGLGAIPSEMYTEIKDLWEREKRKYLMERSANILLASVYGLIPPEEALELAREWKLVGEQGVKTWSPLEAEYDPKGYHTGAIWGLTTAAGMYVAMEAGDWDLALTLRDALLKRAKWTHFLDEVWDARTGEPLGADVQLWSASLIIRAIDEVMVNKRMIPPDVSKIRRIRWEKGGMKHIAIG